MRSSCFLQSPALLLCLQHLTSSFNRHGWNPAGSRVLQPDSPSLNIKPRSPSLSLKRGAISAATSAGVLLVVGIVIGAAVFYSSFALAGRALTTTSTLVVTSTEVVQVTSSAVAAVPPAQAIVAITGVHFPAVGSLGVITLFNLGSANTTVASASLSYSLQTCYLTVPSSGFPVKSGASTLDWDYMGGTACPGVPNVIGNQFVGTLTFANGAQVGFAGEFA